MFFIIAAQKIIKKEENAKRYMLKNYNKIKDIQFQ